MTAQEKEEGEREREREKKRKEREEAKTSETRGPVNVESLGLYSATSISDSSSSALPSCSSS